MRRRIGWMKVAAVILLLASSLAGADKMWKDASVQVGDIKTHYLEGGTGDRHLIFIPDLAMAAEVWKEQIPYFAARGFHVFAIDPRSQGSTTRTETGNTYEQQAADLHAFLEKMKLEHCTLIGWAAGAVALLEYVSSPETLKPDALVFVDEVPLTFNNPDYPVGLTVQQIRARALAMEDDRAKATEAFVNGLFKSKQNGQVYKDLSDGSMKTPTGTAIALLFDLITGDRRPALTSIVVPTLIVVPEDRQLFGAYMQSKIAGSHLSVIPDVGRALFLEKPQAFNQALEDFLGKQ
ncbi:MAG: alpha/beta hydrolase [Acidobacteriia bacterium]|nr:alpha/beta hydrolase [Terriglobia bacterium]